MRIRQMILLAAFVSMLLLGGCGKTKGDVEIQTDDGKAVVGSVKTDDFTMTDTDMRFMIWLRIS